MQMTTQLTMPFKRNSIFLGALVMAMTIGASATSFAKPNSQPLPVVKARVCELESVGKDHYRVMFVEDGKSRYPELNDLFDAMNAKGSTLFEDLLRDEELPSAQHSQEIALHIPKHKPVPVWFKSKPKVGAGDPACKDQKQTGYECRVNQLRADPDTGGLPDGIHTKLNIKISKSATGFAEGLTTQLGCEKKVLPNGAPLGFDEPMKSPIKLVPSGGGKTTP